MTARQSPAGARTETDPYAERLARACDRLGLSATPRQTQQLLDYVQLLHRWNRTYNLTAIRDPAQMLVQHVFDSLAVLPALERGLSKGTAAPTAVSVLDIGSGAGLPGVVLAIMRAWRVDCVDAVEKKTAFVRQVAGTLGLGHLHAHHGRIEQLPSFGCTVATSRAFSSLVDFAALAAPHLSADGTLAAMKGRVPDAEIDALHQTGLWQVTAIDAIEVPELDAQRCLVWIRRNKGTI